MTKELKMGKGFLDASKNAKKPELVAEFLTQDLKNKVAQKGGR